MDRVEQARLEKSMQSEQTNFKDQILMIRSTELDFLTAIEGDVSEVARQI